MTPTDSNKAYLQVKEMIVTTQMRPGSVIHETQLMEILGLGRTPIREALKLLESEKLVVVSPRRGMFVADVTITDLLHIEEIRLELDSLCVRLAVERITPQQLAEMRALRQAFEACEGSCDQETLLLLDRKFHRLLAEASQNRLLQAELETFYNLSLRIWYLYIERLQPNDLAADAFAEILAGIETKDVPRAERAIRRHIMHFQESIKRHL